MLLLLITNIYNALGALQKFNVKATEKGITLKKPLDSLSSMKDDDKFDKDASKLFPTELPF